MALCDYDQKTKCNLVEVGVKPLWSVLAYITEEGGGEERERAINAMPSHPRSSSSSTAGGETVVCCRWQIAKNHVSTNNSPARRWKKERRGGGGKEANVERPPRKDGKSSSFISSTILRKALRVRLGPSEMLRGVALVMTNAILHPNMSVQWKS